MAGRVDDGVRTRRQVKAEEEEAEAAASERERGAADACAGWGATGDTHSAAATHSASHAVARGRSECRARSVPPLVLGAAMFLCAIVACWVYPTHEAAPSEQEVMNAHALLSRLHSTLAAHGVSQPHAQARALYKALLSRRAGVPAVILLSGRAALTDQVVSVLRRYYADHLPRPERCVTETHASSVERIYNVTCECAEHGHAFIAVHHAFTPPSSAAHPPPAARSASSATHLDFLEAAIDDSYPHVQLHPSSSHKHGSVACPSDHAVFVLTASFSPDAAVAECAQSPEAQLRTRTGGGEPSLVDIECAADEVRDTLRFLVSDRFNQRVQHVLALV